mmetsp:Transcript_30353/g.49397  ORF Transcript_30353/g.49397 Transcript_30353/m.49397 type:complete len:298 (-) Transcript_30353:1528-2421(-)
MISSLISSSVRAWCPSTRLMPSRNSVRVTLPDWSSSKRAKSCCASTAGSALFRAAAPCPPSSSVWIRCQRMNSCRDMEPSPSWSSERRMAACRVGDTCTPSRCKSVSSSSASSSPLSSSSSASKAAAAPSARSRRASSRVSTQASRSKSAAAIAASRSCASVLSPPKSECAVSMRRLRASFPGFWSAAAPGGTSLWSSDKRRSAPPPPTPEPFFPDMEPRGERRGAASCSSCSNFRAMLLTSTNAPTALAVFCHRRTSSIILRLLKGPIDVVWTMLVTSFPLRYLNVKKAGKPARKK